MTRSNLSWLLRCCYVALGLFAVTPAWAEADAPVADKRVVILRHGEKPPKNDDFGQLSATGLIRSEKLPLRLKQLFGTPDALMAPQPVLAPDGTRQGRALATLLPTATYFGIAPHAAIATDADASAAAEIKKLLFQDKRNLVFVAWEHHSIPRIVKALGVNKVPTWQDDDFDSLWVLNFKRNGGGVPVLDTTTYRENLNAANDLQPASSDTAPETIVFIRHGEKPAAGLGQLDCQGLNRALALPNVLVKKFGKPAALFAPDPGQVIDDRGTLQNYIRPLATIEPTAIQLGMPVNTALGYQQIDLLQQLLIQPGYRHATVFVAWEHKQIEKLVRQMMQQYGADPAQVPIWETSDFDSIYLVRLTYDAGGKPRISFQRDKEGLNGMPQVCPAAAQEK